MNGHDRLIADSVEMERGEAFDKIDRKGRSVYDHVAQKIEIGMRSTVAGQARPMGRLSLSRPRSTRVSQVSGQCGKSDRKFTSFPEGE